MPYRVASSPNGEMNGLKLNEHALFWDAPDGASHVFYRTFNRGWPHPKHHYGGNGTPNAHARQKEFPRAAVEAALEPGEFHPRIWRGHEHPPSHEVGLLEAETSTRRVVDNLCAQLKGVFWHIEPERSNRTTFGHELRALLIAACTEVESSWKAVLGAHEYPNESRWTTNDYVRLAQPLHLAEWSVSLANHPSWGDISPFSCWSQQQPTASIRWYDAYNAAKHDREGALDRATLEHVVEAVAAAQILMHAQFGWSITAEDVFHLPPAWSSAVFVLNAAPSWTADEEYVAPLVGFDGPPGREKWTPKTLHL